MNSVLKTYRKCKYVSQVVQLNKDEHIFVP